MKQLLARRLDLVSGLRKLRELERHDQWTAQQLAAHQQAALNRLVDYAARHSRFHQRRFDAANVRPGSPLSAFPTMSKEDVMGNFDDIVTDPRLTLSDLERHLAEIDGDELWLGEYRVLSTGGTTGVKGIFVYDRHAWSTLVGGTLRWPRTAGMPFLNRGRRWRIVTLGGSASQAMSERAARSNNIGNSIRLALSATEPLPRLVKQITEFGPTMLVGYASMLALLADEQREGRLNISPRSIISHSEQLSSPMRQRIVSAWSTEPFNAYSTTETGPIGCECSEHTGIHLFEDVVILEVVDEENSPVPPGTSGHKVLATNLFNWTQPLIRYEITDLLTLSADVCPCRRPFRLVAGIHGRSSDLLQLPGSPGPITVHPNRLIRSIEGDPDVRQFQIVNLNSEINVKVVVRPSARSDLTSELTGRLHAGLRAIGAQGTRLRVTVVDSLPRSSSPAAKHMLLIDQRARNPLDPLPATADEPAPASAQPGAS
jgi:phenylacetate-coenzyme A ligase PaaK-like adenylate-forming protein